METLNDSSWDVVIAGTGLHQSLLALALSRSGKKILHVDENGYYGGTEAAFSTQEAEEWAESIGSTGCSTTTPFSNASIWRPSQPVGENAPKLSFPRSYSLTLSPQLIYSLSDILPSLVASKTYRQLEFLAMGSWWVFDRATSETSAEEKSSTKVPGSLSKVPGSREDIFADTSLVPRAKRALMKFLRFLVNFEEEELWESSQDKPFLEFLTDSFGIPPSVYDATFALTLSSLNPSSTTTGFALPRIARHLRSIGVFGPGFGSVIPKWGGLAEITQVACRAGAVGGGVYVLGKGLQKAVYEGEAVQAEKTESNDSTSKPLVLRLSGDETITSNWLTGCIDDLLPTGLVSIDPACEESSGHVSSKSITIVSPSLDTLFHSPAEGAPPPAGAVVTFPSGSLSEPPQSPLEPSAHPPVTIFIHSSDTGGCPSGQSVLYSNVATSGKDGFGLLEKAVWSLLGSLESEPSPTALWSLRYEQSYNLPAKPSLQSDHIVVFPQTSSDLAFDDTVLGRVKEAWQKIMGSEAEEKQFLVFEDRETPDDGDDD